MRPDGGGGLGAAAWILWLRYEYSIFEKVSYGGRVLMNASAIITEREAVRMDIEHLTVFFPTEVSSFDFQVEYTDRTVQYKLNAQSLRLFGLHRDVNDAHRTGANRFQNKNNKSASMTITLKRRRNEIRVRIVTSMLSDCPEMFIFGTYWRPEILWSVNKLARSITKLTKPVTNA